MTTKERLKQYIDNDEVYQGYKNGNINLTDFEKFCIQHCKDIEEILEENQQYKEVIDKLTFIKNRARAGATQETINKLAITFVNAYLKEVE